MSLLPAARTALGRAAGHISIAVSPLRAHPTVDYYLLNALADLVASEPENRPGQPAVRPGKRPIVRLGPHLFAANDRAILVRYATRHELELLNARSWRSIDYVIDDIIPLSEACSELPWLYRGRMGTFANTTLRRILALGPRIVAPSEPVLSLFPGFERALLDPAYVCVCEDASHFAPAGPDAPFDAIFLGTLTHTASFDFIGEIAERAAQPLPRLRLTILHRKRLPRRLREAGNVIARPPLSWPAFRSFIGIERYHAVVAPLPETPFNRGRSITRILDTAAIGAVGLYGDRPPFAGCVTDKISGRLLPDDPDEWVSALCDLAGDPGMAAELATRGAALARKIGSPSRVRQFWLERLDLLDVV